MKKVIITLAALGATVVLAAPASADPAFVVQAYGQPSTGLCDGTDAPAAVNVPGAPTGGWRTGWGTWLNDGKGGVACVRVLIYVNGTKSWVTR